MDLNDLDPCRVRESYRICHRHFNKEYCIPGRHGADLTANAIPSLFIPSGGKLICLEDWSLQTFACIN